jgi:hypothetical protein
MDKHEGGVEAIRAIVLDDKLGIAAELEQRMQFLIDVRCAWAYLGSGSFEPFGI